jgi:hypothetical protein
MRVNRGSTDKPLERMSFWIPELFMGTVRITGAWSPADIRSKKDDRSRAFAVSSSRAIMGPTCTE